MFSVSRILLLHILFFLLFFFCRYLLLLLSFVVVFVGNVIAGVVVYHEFYPRYKKTKITHTQIHHRNKIIIILCTLICVLKWCNLHIAHTHKNLSFLIPDNPIPIQSFNSNVSIHWQGSKFVRHWQHQCLLPSIRPKTKNGLLLAYFKSQHTTT